MANNIYVVDQLAPTGPTVVVNDDGSGIDEIRIVGVYSQVVNITLAWSWSSTTKQAAGTYYPNPVPDNSSGRLIVNGIIENARGSNSADYIIGNELANTIYGDAARTGPGGNDTLSLSGPATIGPTAARVMTPSAGRKATTRSMETAATTPSMVTVASIVSKAAQARIFFQADGTMATPWSTRGRARP